jgi:polysaccharide biosynthesis protein PslG
LNDFAGPNCPYGTYFAHPPAARMSIIVKAIQNPITWVQKNMSRFPRNACRWQKNANGLLLSIVLFTLPIISGFAAASELTVSPATENFGTVIVGTSQSLTVTITNTTSTTLKVSRVAIYGPGFTLKGLTTPLILSAHEVSTFQVVYAPSSGAASSGGLVVISDAADSPQRVTLSGTGWVPVSSVVPNTYLGMVLHPEVVTGQVPWPTISFGAMRLWATQTQWSALNPSEGTYNWTQLNNWFNIAAQNGKADLIYTFGSVPQWASSKPNDQTCVSQVTAAGSCDAPYDVNADGSGADKLWQDYVTALVAQSAGRIKYWELWNEPDCAWEWNGTIPQMVRMAKDAYTIIKAADPSAMVTTPSSVNAGSGHSIDIWLPAYLAAGGGNYADIVAFHGYINPALGQEPEAITRTVDQVTSSLTGALTTKPIWNTEGGWTQNSNLPNANMEAAFVARVYILQWFKGVQRFYWFQYGNTSTGTFWTSAGTNTAGIAYGEVYDWLVGANLNGPCSAAGTVWTCPFTKPGGVQALAVWDASKTCSGNNCATSSYVPNTAYTKYTNLAGNVTSFAPGATIQIGAEPILLQNK